jgi:hypothetical protein
MRLQLFIAPISTFLKKPLISHKSHRKSKLRSDPRPPVGITGIEKQSMRSFAADFDASKNAV